MAKKQTKITTLGYKGIDIADNSQLQDMNSQLTCLNYLIKGEGYFEKRKGFLELINDDTDEPITMLEPYLNRFLVYGYGSVVGLYDTLLGTKTELKDDFPVTENWAGSPSGSYFFLTSPELNSIMRIEQYTGFTAKSLTKVKIASLNPKTRAEDDFTVYDWSGGTVISFRASAGGADIATATVVTHDPDTGILIVSGISTTTALETTTVLTSGGSGSGYTFSATFQHFGIQAGEKITGNTSGAIAIIDKLTSTGLQTGEVVLSIKSGAFIAGETVTGLNGQTFVMDTVPLPRLTLHKSNTGAKVLKVFGGRMFLGAPNGAKESVLYSYPDTGSGVPFQNFTIGSAITRGGQVFYPNGGEVTDILPIGNAVLTLHENGYNVFAITTIDLGGVLSKSDEVIDARTGLGGARGAINTEEGIFYMNEGGLFLVASLPEKNVPFSGQVLNISQSLLGKDYFLNADLTNCSIAYDKAGRYLFIAYATEGSEVNNAVLAYHLDYKAFAQITGWTVNRFATIGAKLYGGSSTESQVGHYLTGTDDNGLRISTELSQELNLAGLGSVSRVEKLLVAGNLSVDSVIDIHFDIYDEKAIRFDDKKKVRWNGTSKTDIDSGWGSESWGSGAWGGSTTISENNDDIAGRSVIINNVQRLKLRFTSNDDFPHTLFYAIVEYTPKRTAIRRNLTKII